MKIEAEDLVLVVGGFTTLIQCHFNVVDPAFTIGVTMIFKGIVSLFIPGQLK